MSGLIGVYSSNKEINVFPHIYYGLHALQHRGQEQMGISLFNGDELLEIKGDGLISDNINENNIDFLKGHQGLGHVKYAFSDEKKQSKIMPLIYGEGNDLSMIIIDGKIINEDFEMQTLIHHLKNLDRDTSEYISSLEGAYGIIYLDQDKMVCIRDNYGIKPLAIGKVDDLVIAASETCAIDTVYGDKIHSLRPGEIFIAEEKGERSLFAKEKDHALCMFEMVYISRDDSYIDGMSVYEARYKMGQLLAKEHPVDADIVVGAPDSGMIAALGYARESGIPYQKGIVRNKYIGRTFISLEEEARELKVHLKLSAIRHNIRGKNIILVDDSIVRGTTIQRVVEILKNAGAKSVHIRISSCPVIESENLSIDIPRKEELIAVNRSLEEMEEIIGCDSLRFLSLESLREACGNKRYYEKYFGGNNPFNKK